MLRNRPRRRWTAALLASLAAHALLLATARFVPTPANLAVEEISPVAILRITKAVKAHGRRGGVPAAPRLATRPRTGTPLTITHGAVARGSAHAASNAEAAGTARAAAAAPRRGATATGSRSEAGPAQAPPGPMSADDEPSPEPVPTITAEMLAKLNVRMREALPSAMPQTMKIYRSGTGLAMRFDPNRITAANYPLPNSGLFAHARIARTAHEAIAVRAIQRIGGAYVCIGYLAKIDGSGGLANAKAGPYIGPCKRAWREQLGISPTPAPSVSPETAASPPPVVAPTQSPPP